MKTYENYAEEIYLQQVSKKAAGIEPTTLYVSLDVFMELRKFSGVDIYMDSSSHWKYKGLDIYISNRPGTFTKEYVEVI